MYTGNRQVVNGTMKYYVNGGIGKSCGVAVSKIIIFSFTLQYHTYLMKVSMCVLVLVFYFTNSTQSWINTALLLVYLQNMCFLFLYVENTCTFVLIRLRIRNFSYIVQSNCELNSCSQNITLIVYYLIVKFKYSCRQCHLTNKHTFFSCKLQ